MLHKKLSFFLVFYMFQNILYFNFYRFTSQQNEAVEIEIKLTINKTKTKQQKD
jgi:hypothetical protein